MTHTFIPKPSPDEDAPEEWDEEVLTDPDAELPGSETPEPVPPS